MPATTLELLLTLQMLIGGFDLLWNHEFSAHLVRRSTARRELQLHAAGIACYALFIFSLAWVEWQGWLAWLFLALIAGEILITLADFVEEDRSRLLPPAERVAHTLLALCYGAILAEMLPAILAAAALPTGAALRPWTPFAAVLTLVALGSLYWSWRDWRHARRLAFPAAMAAPLADEFLGAPRRLLMTDGTSLLGRRLVAALVEAGHDVTLLLPDRRQAAWLPTPLRLVESLAQLPPASVFDAVLQLAPDAKLTDALAAWCRQAAVPPRLLLGVTSMGIYGDRGDAVLDETAVLGEDPAAKTCATAEAALAAAAAGGLRSLALRLGPVLATEGGLLARLLLAAELGLAPVMGNGRQWLAWIHRDDAVRLICWLLAQPDAAGVYNACAPYPLPQAVLAARLAHCFHLRALRLPVPRWLLALLVGARRSESLLAGQRALPRRALAAGFRFRHPHPAQALVDLAGHGAVPDLEPLVRRDRWMTSKSPRV